MNTNTNKNQNIKKILNVKSLASFLSSGNSIDKDQAKKIAIGNFERMCHDAPQNRFIFRWSN